MKRRVLIAIGGIVGTSLRWAVIDRFASVGGFPTVVLLINAFGSFVLGVVLAESIGRLERRDELRDALSIGFCGGLTTFSTFAVEVAQLGRSGQSALAVLYLASSVAATLCAIYAGARAGTHVGGLQVPVEGPEVSDVLDEVNEYERRRRKGSE